MVHAEPHQRWGRQGRRPARGQRRVRVLLRRLHGAGLRLQLRRARRVRERIVRIQRLLPGAGVTAIVRYKPCSRGAGGCVRVWLCATGCGVYEWGFAECPRSNTR